MKNNSALFYTCSLIEFIGRERKLKRSELVSFLGSKVIERIYRQGAFDNVAACRYDAPDYWTIGEVYERLIEDMSGDDAEHIPERLIEIYTSWIDDVISNYNTDFYYQPRDYICECYRKREICA